jgi:hypothetical protein
MIAAPIGLNQITRMNVSAMVALGLAPLCVHASQPAPTVRIGEPLVVAVAARPEKWGFFQFPSLARWADGTVAARWSLAADSIVSYGTGQSSSAISRDGGKTWTEPQGQKGGTGLLLPNGDRIQVVSPKAIKVSEP